MNDPTKVPDFNTLSPLERALWVTVLAEGLPQQPEQAPLFSPTEDAVYGKGWEEHYNAAKLRDARRAIEHANNALHWFRKAVAP